MLSKAKTVSSNPSAGSPSSSLFRNAAEDFFAGVALMEDFDVKTRGTHFGTSAMQRAGINLEDLQASDFFSAVNLPKPQISIAYVTDL